MPYDFSDASISAPPFASDEIFGGPANFTDFSTGCALQDFCFDIGSTNLQGNVEDRNHPSNTLDAPPVVSEDFEWDEKNLPNVQTPESEGTLVGPGLEEGDEYESIVADGMASLTLDESEGGYLGVASGAALLRLIEPLAIDQSVQRVKANRLRRRRLSSGSPSSRTILFEAPNPNTHVSDAMIDAYFRLFHTCYPLVHEPTFRAQYAGVIERPHGKAWSVLAYIIAAIGVFTSGIKANNLDLALFAHAKSFMSISFLESGNLTMVQFLILMSNYLQKRNKPNSGYNYLGIAVRMAMGIGLHKEFQGWKISPLKMEIRRRIWWCLSVFENGCTYTFSRPLMWPKEGVETALPMNIHDRVFMQQWPHVVSC